MKSVAVTEEVRKVVVIKQPIELPKLPSVQQSKSATSNRIKQPVELPKPPVNSYPKLPTVQYAAQGVYEVTKEEGEVDNGQPLPVLRPDPT